MLQDQSLAASMPMHPTASDHYQGHLARWDSIPSIRHEPRHWWNKYEPFIPSIQRQLFVQFWRCYVGKSAQADIIQQLWAEVVPCFSVVILDSLQGVHVKFLATGPQGCHCPPSPTPHCDALCISTQRTAMIQNSCYMFLSDVWCQIMMPLNCSSSQQV